MLHLLAQIGQSIGGFILSVCVVAGAACAIAFCVGLFCEQQAKLFKLNEYNAVEKGFQCGALGGIVFSIYAISQLGTVTALFSVLGLVLLLLLLSAVTAIVRGQVRPTPIPQD